MKIIKCFLSAILITLPLLSFATSVQNVTYIKLLENGAEIDNNKIAWIAKDIQGESVNFGNPKGLNWGSALDKTWIFYKLKEDPAIKVGVINEEAKQCFNANTTNNKTIDQQCYEQMQREYKSYINASTEYESKNFYIIAAANNDVEKTLTIDIRKNTIEDSNPDNKSYFEDSFKLIAYAFYVITGLYIMGFSILILCLVNYFKTRKQKFLLFAGIVVAVLSIPVIIFLIEI